MSKIDELMPLLIQALEEAQLADAGKKALLAVVQNDPGYIDLDKKAKAAKERADSITEKIRILGKAHYLRKGDKHPHPQVEIKIFKIAKITKRNLALKWALDRLPEAILLNEKIIQSYILNIGPIPGVEITDDPRTYISQTLKG